MQIQVTESRVFISCSLKRICEESTKKIDPIEKADIAAIFDEANKYNRLLTSSLRNNILMLPPLHLPRTQIKFAYFAHVEAMPKAEKRVSQVEKTHLF